MYSRPCTMEDTSAVEVAGNVRKYVDPYLKVVPMLKKARNEIAAQAATSTQDSAYKTQTGLASGLQPGHQIQAQDVALRPENADRKVMVDDLDSSNSDNSSTTTLEDEY
ncbi:hypothetical protein EJ02DRAFT_488039 [Clathrospora elynae]|uniref:Uncharacterized protein n=1 Tax=Clathrospora elynae TaxID=706981 RepID=A0A6A5SSY4_9PLEO|nr:hypothetical protein EJ02DRAFT_488039 [Clathrospora elynae]